MAQDSLTTQLVGLLRARPIAPEDRSLAARYVLDTLAGAIAATTTTQGRAMLDWARAHGGGDAGRRAMLLGALSHQLELDDLHRASSLHPGAVVIPAAWAAAEELGARGHALLDAVFWGYEVTCRVGRAVGPAHYHTFHNTATCGPFGAAAAAGKLLDLDDAQLVDALGTAGTMAAGLQQYLAGDSMAKPLHAGRAAEAGVVAAELALRGIRGAPAILEGEKGFFAALCKDATPEAVLAEPERSWELALTSLKPWPCCRHTHPLIDAALEASRTLGGDVSGLERVEVGSYRAALAMCDRPEPSSPSFARFSLQHAAAAALTDGRVDLASFDDDAIDRLAELRGKVVVSFDKGCEHAYPRAWGARLTLYDGVVPELREFVREHALGDPELPLDEGAVINKAGDQLFAAGVDVPTAQLLCHDILALADDGPLPELPSTARDQLRRW